MSGVLHLGGGRGGRLPADGRTAHGEPGGRRAEGGGERLTRLQSGILHFARSPHRGVWIWAMLSPVGRQVHPLSFEGAVSDMEARGLLVNRTPERSVFASAWQTTPEGRAALAAAKEGRG